MVKKIARPSSEPWQMPSSSTQPGAEPSGAQTEPASPAPAPIRLGTTSLCCPRLR